jgi:hypothetical protein
MANKNLKIDKAYLIWVFIISAFCGLMVASAGIAIYPPIVKVTEPVVGKIRIETQDYSYKPGQSGTSISFYVTNRQGIEEEKTFYAGFIAFLIYTFIIYLLFISYRFISIIRLRGSKNSNYIVN